MRVVLERRRAVVGRQVGSASRPAGTALAALPSGHIALARDLAAFLMTRAQWERLRCPLPCRLHGQPCTQVRESERSAVHSEGSEA